MRGPGAEDYCLKSIVRINRRFCYLRIDIVVLWFSFWGQSTEYVDCWRAEDGRLKKFDELYQPMGMINSPFSGFLVFNGIWFSSYVVLGAGFAGIWVSS